MVSPEPIVRLHLWLENDEGMLFGIGKAQLLAGIERHGSLSRAAKEIGMSYRAAWGKIKQAEKALGLQLVEKSGNCRNGCHLTVAGKIFKEQFDLWFAEVEQAALCLAKERFPWPIRPYLGTHGLDGTEKMQFEKNSGHGGKKS